MPSRCQSLSVNGSDDITMLFSSVVVDQFFSSKDVGYGTGSTFSAE